jgi:hypothetical protein
VGNLLKKPVGKKKAKKPAKGKKAQTKQPNPLSEDDGTPEKAGGLVRRPSGSAGSGASFSSATTSRLSSPNAAGVGASKQRGRVSPSAMGTKSTSSSSLAAPAQVAPAFKMVKRGDDYDRQTEDIGEGSEDSSDDETYTPPTVENHKSKKKGAKKKKKKKKKTKKKKKELAALIESSDSESSSSSSSSSVEEVQEKRRRVKPPKGKERKGKARPPKRKRENDADVLAMAGMPLLLCWFCCIMSLLVHVLETYS